MADSAGMSIQPGEVAEVSRQLDELASRAQRVLADEAPVLTVTASGRDEAIRHMHLAPRHRTLRRPLSPAGDALCQGPSKRASM